MRKVSDKGYRQNQNIYFIFKNYSESHALYDVRCKIIVQPGRLEITIKCGAEEIPFAPLKTKAHHHNRLIQSDFLKWLWQF
jgi:hypothetical protein